MSDMKHATYLVMAIRWGATNGSWYLVYAGPDLTKAHALAQAENADRGGKYACALFGFDADGVKYETLGYFPSSMEPEDATQPYHNHKKDYFEALGIFLSDAAEGKALLPSLNDHKVLKYQTIECPQVFKDEVARRRKVYQAMAAIEVGGDEQAAKS